jgi:hypothetical protein
MPPKPAVEPTDKPRMGKVVARASANPINIGVGAAAATLAIGLGSAPLAALGVLAYGAMVAFDSFNPAFWKKVYGGKPSQLPTPKLPDPKKVTDPGTRAAIAQITASKAELDRVLRDTPVDVVSTLATTIASLGELEGHAARLVVRAEDIAEHLAKVDEEALRTDSALLAQRAKATRDDSARKGFEEAKAARDDELRTIGELRAAKDRIDANLSHLVAVLGGLPTKVVHMRTLDGQAVDQMSGDMNEELEAVGRELKTSEEVMKSLGEIVR